MGDLNNIQQLNAHGFCHLPEVFSHAQVDEFKTQIQKYIDENHEGIVHEADSSAVRGIHGPHLYSDFFQAITNKKEFLELASSLLGEPCYVHQFKINIKRRMVGQHWPWHEDFVYWNKKDGIKEPNMLNIVIFLDKVELLNGPLCVIPSSHHIDDLTDVEAQDSAWQQDVSASLTYQLSEKRVEALIKQYGVHYLMGNAGDVTAFHPKLAHSSANNMSPWDRQMVIITYNAISNAPSLDKPDKRPAFLCSEDFTPLVAES
ncbi:phytanoyl-CoA dioxygenase family protein [Pseudoalteromonas luteoviolacea]|uniref:phytanoyl-CoA dioxygenase family protein n=1 Tax=Pseudoalteromonas luteoviolacea TaxID=43657 RepID=UPI001B3838F5|nr:phytanoyl-CoA dioxygenase family protein [Pseudoalteromonas luteoviolacea]MBQ4814056.1 phytanoyl-CoA dioxygenase family protein [Pseudoalteromonas luteoviolacea]